MNTTTNKTETTETIPAHIANVAMDLVMDGTFAPADAVFFAAIDMGYWDEDVYFEDYDARRVFAKAYGIAHWAELTEETRTAWDKCFASEMPKREHYDMRNDWIWEVLDRRSEPATL